MLHFDNEVYKTCVTVDPTKRQFDELSRGIGLDEYELSVGSFTTEHSDIICLAVSTKCECGAVNCKMFVSMHHLEYLTPTSRLAESIRLTTVADGWIPSKACPTVFYSFVPFVMGNRNQIASLKKFALHDLHLDQCLHDIEVAMTALGFPAQTPTGTFHLG